MYQLEDIEVLVYFQASIDQASQISFLSKTTFHVKAALLIISQIKKGSHTVLLSPLSKLNDRLIDIRAF